MYYLVFMQILDSLHDLSSNILNLMEFNCLMLSVFFLNICGQILTLKQFHHNMVLVHVLVILFYFLHDNILVLNNVGMLELLGHIEFQVGFSQSLQRYVFVVECFSYLCCILSIQAVDGTFENLSLSSTTNFLQNANLKIA